MRNALQRLTAAIVALLILAILAGRTAWAQTTTATETRTFEVIAVVGDRVVVQEPAGTREYTIPPGFRFTVDGKRVNVSDLKPGMKGTATITTTTVKPVQVTSVVDAEVVRVSGPAVIVRGPKSLQMFSPGDVERRSVTIHRDGRLVELSDLREGDRLTATIVTEGTPKVLTEREVEAALAAVPVAAAPLPSPPASAPATAPFSEPPAGGERVARSRAGDVSCSDRDRHRRRKVPDSGCGAAGCAHCCVVGTSAQRRLIAQCGERHLPRRGKVRFEAAPHVLGLRRRDKGSTQGRRRSTRRSDEGQKYETFRSGA